MAVLSVVWLAASAGPAWASPITLQNATATFSQPGYEVSKAIDGSFDGVTGWAIANGACNCTSAETAYFETLVDQGFAEGTVLSFTLSQLFYYPASPHTIGRFRLSLTTAPEGFNPLTATWTQLTPMSASATNGVVLGIIGNDVQASGPDPVTTVYTIKAQTLLVGITGFRLETLLDASFPTDGPGRASNGNFVLTEFQADAVPVPEPATLGLMLAGLGALRYARRRPAR